MKEGDTQNPSLFSEGKSKSFATLRVHGNLSKLPDGRRLDEQKLIVPITVGDLLTRLNSLQGIDVKRDSTLVLVNGVEASALQDLETVIQECDEVSLVPMFHGGAE